MDRWGRARAPPRVAPASPSPRGRKRTPQARASKASSVSRQCKRNSESSDDSEGFLSGFSLLSVSTDMGARPFHYISPGSIRLASGRGDGGRGAQRRGQGRGEGEAEAMPRGRTWRRCGAGRALSLSLWWRLDMSRCPRRRSSVANSSTTTTARASSSAEGPSRRTTRRRDAQPNCSICRPRG
jgi:hypothetical protein